jgi:hypothetical protein
LQVNFADQHVNLYGKQLNIYQQYRVLESKDGISWQILLDKSKNFRDVPNDYTELPKAVETRYLKVVNIHIPGGNFAIGDFRVFGIQDGPKPEMVKNFSVIREKDKRNADLKWEAVKGAYAYNIYYGIRPDKLDNCIMVIDQDHFNFRGLNRDESYYFSIQTLAETGVSVIKYEK